MSSSNSRSSPNPNHRLLAESIKEIASSSQDAKEKFADVITAMAVDGEMRDFDMGVFFTHFGLDSLQKCILAVSLKTNPRMDLRNKGLLFPLPFFCPPSRGEVPLIACH
jgi:CCR4-NOT transcription complex subunit 1